MCLSQGLTDELTAPERIREWEHVAASVVDLGRRHGQREASKSAQPGSGAGSWAPSVSRSGMSCRPRVSSADTYALFRTKASREPEYCAHRVHHARTCDPDR